MPRPFENPERASEAGKKGSAELKRRYGRDHFVRMGRKGGATRAARTDMVALGKAGVKKRWDRVRAAKEAADGAP